MVGGLPERDDVRPVNRRQQELGTSILYRGTVSDLPQDGGKQLIDIRRPQFLLSGVGTRVRARKVVFSHGQYWRWLQVGLVSGVGLGVSDLQQ